jgi:hypothetical protein
MLFTNAATAMQAVRWLRWDRYTLPLLQATAVGLTSSGLAAVLTALCLDSRHLSGGMPDLLLIRATHKASVSTFLH